MNTGTVIVTEGKCPAGKVAKGERASPEGVVRRTKFKSAAEYKIRAAI